MKKEYKPYWFFEKFAIIFVLFCFMQSACTNSRYIARSDSPRSRVEAWDQDLSHFQKNYFDLCKSFSSDEIIKANEIIDSIKLNVDNLSDNQIKLLISKAVSMADDGHTTVYFGKFENIPLKLYLFDDGLYVTSAKSGYEQYLGAQVNRIENKSIKELLGQVDSYLSGNKSWIKYRSSFLLTCPDFLEGIELTNNRDSIKYEFIIGQDTLTKFLSADKKYDDLNEFDSWRNLTPSNKMYADTINDWVHLMTKKIPIYLSQPNVSGFIKHIDSLDALYVQINSATKIPKFLDTVKNGIDSTSVKNLIVDLRFNTGGNYLKYLNISKNIPKLVEGKIFIVTGHATFSAGICIAARLKYFAKEKAIVVGQVTGDELVFWAEGKRFILPNSELPIRVATGFHDWESNNFEPFKSFWLNKFYGVPAKNLKLNIPVSNNFIDYMNGRDKILEEIKHYLNK